MRRIVPFVFFGLMMMSMQLHALTHTVTSGICSNGIVWIQVNFYNHGELYCSMGKSCNGKSFDNCTRDVHDSTLEVPDNDEVYVYWKGLNQDQLSRANNGDTVATHIQYFSLDSTMINVMADVGVRYEIADANTASIVYLGGSTVSANTPAMISIAGFTDGVYILVARNSYGVSVGVQGLVIPEP